MRNHYFVVEPELIVAQDLAHAIKVFDPKAKVHLFRSTPEAWTALLRLKPKAILLQADPVSFAKTPMAEALTEREVPYALTGPDAQTATESGAVLALPFSEASVAALLRRLLNSGDSDGGPG